MPLKTASQWFPRSSFLGGGVILVCPHEILPFSFGQISSGCHPSSDLISMTVLPFSSALGTLRSKCISVSLLYLFIREFKSHFPISHLSRLFPQKLSLQGVRYSPKGASLLLQCSQPVFLHFAFLLLLLFWKQDWSNFSRHHSFSLTSGAHLIPRDNIPSTVF